MNSLQKIKISFMVFIFISNKNNNFEHSCRKVEIKKILLCDKKNYVIKPFEYKSRSRNLKRLTHKEFEKCIGIKHTIESLDFYDLE